MTTISNEDKSKAIDLVTAAIMLMDELMEDNRDAALLFTVSEARQRFIEQRKRIRKEMSINSKSAESAL